MRIHCKINQNLNSYIFGYTLILKNYSKTITHVSSRFCFARIFKENVFKKFFPVKRNSDFQNVCTKQEEFSVRSRQSWATELSGVSTLNLLATFLFL